MVLEDMVKNCSSEGSKERAINAVSTLLHCEGDYGVWLTAVSFACKVHLKGDRRFMDPVASRYQDTNKFVRITVAGGLPDIASQGNEQVIRILVHLVTDNDKEVRIAALRGLPQIAPKHDVLALNAITASLEDEDEQVRMEAAKVFNCMAEVQSSELKPA